MKRRNFRPTFVSIFSALLLIWASTPVNAWFADEAQLAFEEQWLPMLDSPSATERLQAVQAFYAFPEWGLPLIRKSLDEGGIGIEPWRAVMLLGMIGEQKDISRILGIIQNNPQLPRPEVWEGAMERLYWKYRMPPKTALKIKELNLKKTKNTELKEGFQLSAASIEFQLQNPSQQTLLVQPHFDFWIGKPEAPPAKRWVQVPAGKTVRVRVPMVFRVPLGRGKIRVDVRIRELGLEQYLIHQTALLAL